MEVNTVFTILFPSQKEKRWEGIKSDSVSMRKCLNQTAFFLFFFLRLIEFSESLVLWEPVTFPEHYG